MDTHALRYYKTGHNNDKELSFVIVVGDNFDVEEGWQFDWWTVTYLENNKYEQ